MFIFLSSRCSFVLLQRQILVALLMTGMLVMPTGFGGGLAVVMANPSGGTVVGGSATISSNPGNVTVRQQSDRAIVNWNSFSIRQGETTTFVQPGSRSAVLNRVTGGSASQLDGRLNANGQVYLVNPNGVVIGKTGRVNAAGFTASTRDIDNAQFMKGGDLTFTGSSGGKVANYGKVKATDGDVTLIAQTVENHGKIRAKNGSVNLAGGSEVLVKPSGSEGQRVFIKTGNGSVVNTGSIRAAAAELRAAGGNEYALAVNNSGVIRATGVDRSGGRIVLKAESTGDGSVRNAGRVENSGRLIASSRAPGKSGGRIDVTGDHVRLTSTSRIEAKSARGQGGTVNIGGGYQGKDASVANAGTTTVEAGSEINVDGGTKGGTSILWSNDRTTFLGHISAKGPGFSSETGGFVEVSSKGVADFRGIADTAGGTVLLDPETLQIISGGGSNVAASTLDPSHILLQLSMGDFTLMATSGITVTTGFTSSYTTDLTLTTTTTSGAGYITFDAPVIFNGVGADLRLNTTTLNLNAAIRLNTSGVPAGVLSGTATTANVGTAGKIQNAVDALASGGTIVLTTGTYREANIRLSKPLTIRGNGYDFTTVTSDVANDGTGDSIVFTVDAGAGNLVTMRSLGITGGLGNGAGVRMNTGNATIVDSLIANNRATTGNDAANRGGGIYVTAGTLTLTNSIVRGNKTTGWGGGIAFALNANGVITDTIIEDNEAKNSVTPAVIHGGGIYIAGGTSSVTISGSTIQRNTAGLNGNGVSDTAGGVRIEAGTLRILSSLIYDNTSEFAGAIYNSNATVYVINSTISNNKATGVSTSAGGAIRMINGTLIINSSTIAENKADADGGGIAKQGGTLRLTNSILSLNYLGGSQTATLANLSGTINSGAFNLIDKPQSELKLAPLGYYGGKIQSYGLLPGSSAINSGGNALDSDGVTALTLDSRGRTRPVGQTDIGSFESQTQGIIVVTNTLDYNLATSPGIDHSLRMALSITNAGLAESNGAISFNIPGGAPGYNAATGRWVITAAAGTSGFSISKTVSLNANSQTGFGGTPLIEVNGNALGSVFAVSSDANATFNGLYITNGTGYLQSGNRYGGGIYANGTGTITINNSIIAGNTATQGGGIYRDAGVGAMTITNSTLEGNTATASGGGIYDLAATILSMGNSTIASNRATSGSGGGIYATGTGNIGLTNVTMAYNHAGGDGGAIYSGSHQLAIRSSTIAFNDADGGEAGGIYMNSGSLILGNSIVARNFGPTTAAGGKDIYEATPTITDEGYNLIGVYDGIQSTLSASTRSGTFAVPLDPLLTSTLANYGGTTKTLALLPGSPAIGGGNPALAATLDQRGETRDATPDIGAYESRGFTYTVDSGSGQATRPGTNFSSPVVIRVAANDVLLTDLTGGVVTLTPPAGGASAIGVPGLTGAIGAGNTASFTLQANTTSGGYDVGIVGSSNVVSLFNQYILTVTPDSGQGITYGDTDSGVYTYGFSGLNGDSIGSVLTGALNRADALNVNAGGYSIGIGTLALTSYGATRYALDFVPGVSFTIATRNITIQADNKTITYGDTEPALTYQHGTLYNGDTISGNLSRQPGLDAGAYDILGDGLVINTGLAANYNITYIPGTFTINRRAVMVAPDAGQMKTYGSDDPLPFTYSTTAGAVTFNGTLGRISGENVGTYAYDITDLAAQNANYLFTLSGGALFTINRALLTVTANNATGVSGQPLPEFSATITGFQRTDNESVVGGLIFNTAAGINSPAGMYSITPGGASALNYEFAYIDGTLTLTSASVPSVPTQPTLPGQPVPPTSPTLPPVVLPTDPASPGLPQPPTTPLDPTAPDFTMPQFDTTAFDATRGRNNEEEGYYLPSGPGIHHHNFTITYEGQTPGSNGNAGGHIIHISTSDVAP